MKKEFEITSMNYEVYALDYAEGRLSGGELAAMEDFLAMHPELRAEITEIWRAVVPHEPAFHGDLDSLKKGGRGLISIPRVTVPAAAAALIILALGMIWLALRKPAYGELAVDHPPLNLYYSIDQAYRTSTIDPGTGSNDYLPTDQPLQRKAIASADAIEADRSGTGSGSIADGDPLKPSDFPGDASGRPPYRIKLQVVYPAVVPVDDYFVLPVTIELHELSMEAGSQAIDFRNETADAEAARMARRKWLKEGAMTLLQETMMPEGVRDLLSN